MRSNHSRIAIVGFGGMAAFGIVMAMATLFLPFFEGPTASVSGLRFVQAAFITTAFLPFGVFAIGPYVSLVMSAAFLSYRHPYRSAVSLAAGIMMVALGTLVFVLIGFPFSNLLIGYYLWLAGASMGMYGSLRLHAMGMDAGSTRDWPSRIGWRQCMRMHRFIPRDAAVLTVSMTIVMWVISVGIAQQALDS